MTKTDKPKLLLHICCGPCATVAARRLMEDYQVVLFFYNPNIEPIAEWQARLAAAQKLAQIYGLPLIIDDADSDDWQTMAEPLAADQERGRRCQLCYEWRLRRTAQRADQEGCAYFATSLTVSPYKDREAINRIGLMAAGVTAANYLPTDFQQADGYRQSIELSKQYELYRQKYCGCRFGRQ